MKTPSDTLREAYTAARRTLIIKYPFLGELSLSLRLYQAEPGDKVETSAVAPDFTLILNEEFFLNKCSRASRVGDVAHEVFHPGLNHFWLMRRFGLRLSNLAGDYALNPLVKAAGLELPPGALMDSRFRHMCSERIAEILEKEQKGGEDGPGGDGDGPGGCGTMREDLCATELGKAAVAGDQAAQAELEMQAKGHVMQAAASAKMQGKLPGDIESAITSMLTPKMSVRERILRFMGQHGPRIERNMARPSRRSEAAGVYLPSLKSGAPKVANLIDTSGSVSQEEFQQYVGFVDQITSELQMDVLSIMCDAAVQDVQEGVVSGADIQKRYGHGGSNFTPAFDYLVNEGFDGVVIALTDGYIAVPQRKPPGVQACLWILSDGRPPTDQWGEIVYLDNDQNS